MSVRIPTRRIGQTALSTTSRQTAPRTAIPLCQSRPLSLLPKKDDKDKDADYSNPLLQKYFAEQQRKPLTKQRITPPKPIRPALSDETSIYAPGVELPGYREGVSESELQELKKAEHERAKAAVKETQKRLAASELDPDPLARLLWERSKVIEGIERRGRLTKPEELARTEREYLFQSHDLATTPKKMTMLMRQIAGKTLEEALVQMRFSKKRVARDIVIGLLKARDEAIVARGMGLGHIKEAPKVEVELEPKENETEEEFEARKAKAEEAQLKKLEERLLSPGTYITPKDGPSKTIELKDGSRKKVYDPTEIYIDQAWATKGIYDYGVDYRARGQAFRLRHRTAKMNVLLKEEKSRMRISDEIKKKRDNRKLWVALPDRPVTAQRQYCLW